MTKPAKLYLSDLADPIDQDEQSEVCSCVWIDEMRIKCSIKKSKDAFSEKHFEIVLECCEVDGGDNCRAVRVFVGFIDLSVFTTSKDRMKSVLLKEVAVKGGKRTEKGLDKAITLTMSISGTVLDEHSVENSLTNSLPAVDIQIVQNDSKAKGELDRAKEKDLEGRQKNVTWLIDEIRKEKDSKVVKVWESVLKDLILRVHPSSKIRFKDQEKDIESELETERSLNVLHFESEDDFDKPFIERRLDPAPVSTSQPFCQKFGICQSIGNCVVS